MCHAPSLTLWSQHAWCQPVKPVRHSFHHGPWDTQRRAGAQLFRATRMPCGNGSCLISVSIVSAPSDQMANTTQLEEPLFNYSLKVNDSTEKCLCMSECTIKVPPSDNTSSWHHQNENLFSNPSQHLSSATPTSDTGVHFNIHILY